MRRNRRPPLGTPLTSPLTPWDTHCVLWWGLVWSSLHMTHKSLQFKTRNVVLGIADFYSAQFTLEWSKLCIYFRNVGQNGLNCPPKQNQLARPHGYVWKIEIALSLALKLVECQSGDGYRPPLTQTSSSDREGRARGGEDEILAGKIWTKLSNNMVKKWWLLCDMKGCKERYREILYFDM